jgi:methyl-accepting chemotaxis protein
VGSKATDLLAEHRGVPGEFWRSAAGLTGQHPVHQFRGSGTVLGGLALRDLAGEPVGLALVQSTDHDLFPQIGPGGQELESASAIIGWLAVVGVLLAIGMGMIAPRWVWHDIRASTDFIFNSVERLRELVRRNSRALDEQSEVIKSLMDSMNELDKASSSIAETSRILAHSAKQSAWVSQSGNQNAETAQRGVLEVRDRVVALSDQTEELERRCAAIGSILGLIDNLSNQTNDLSINATIQAAGAGMAGKQFATVASEIGKLAEQARKSTRDVQTVIEQIQESSRTTLDATRDGSREVERCLESFEELESAFARILRWVEQTTQSAHGIEQSTAVQAESLQAVSQSIESLEYRARETVGNYQAVVEAADELAMLGAEMNETWRVG